MKAREMYALQTGIAALVYVFDADHGVKIGITKWADIGPRKTDRERSGGQPLTFVRAWKFSDYGTAYQVEQAAHWLLRDTRTIGEWFHCHPLEACDAIDRLIRHGMPLAYIARNDRVAA